MTFVLTTAIFRNSRDERGKIPKIVYLISLYDKTLYPHIICIAVDETVIKIREIKCL